MNNKDKRAARRVMDCLYCTFYRVRRYRAKRKVNLSIKAAWSAAKYPYTNSLRDMGLRELRQFRKYGREKS